MRTGIGSDMMFTDWLRDDGWFWAAIRNAGYHFPSDRITINLAPADIKKEAAVVDEVKVYPFALLEVIKL